MDDIKRFEDATVKSASKHGIVLEVDGVEVHASSRVRNSACECCAPRSEVTYSYNRHTDDRIDKHGEADPLGLHEDGIAAYTP